MVRRSASVAIIVVIAAITTWFAVKDVDGTQLLAALTAANYGLVALALFVTFGGYAVRAWRWQIMVEPIKPLPFAEVFPVLVLGFAWNVLVPLRIGELVRAHLLGVRAHMNRPALLATVVVERVLDGAAVMALLALVGWLYPDVPQWVEDFARIATILFGIALAGMTMLILAEGVTLRFAGQVAGRLPGALGERLEQLLRAVVLGYGALRSPRRLAAVVLTTALAWGIEVGTYAILFVAFGLTPPAEVFASAAAFYAVVLNLATLVPSPPGYVATIEGFGVAALGVFGVDAARALSVTVVGHVVQLAAIITLGGWALWREGLSAAELLRTAHDRRG